jgi:AbiV family abortive infection protein
VDAEEILQGAYYAMEQSGRLLADAVALYQRRSWPSSLVLAVFSFEELGKAETLYRRAIDAQVRGPKEPEEVMQGQSHHITKLREGRDLLTIDASVGFWGEPPDMDSAEGRQILEHLRLAQETALANAPGEAHQARMQALYVDLRDGTWVRPIDTTASDAYLMVSAAAIQYAAYREKFMHPENAFVAAAVRDRRVPVAELAEAPRVEWPR